ncbi:MAG: hypothetical protein HKN43_08180 [Rhodothermales bacterium]|nr:hypothetical protein [Rhodothermales bacterium]
MFDIFRCNAKSGSISDEFRVGNKRRVPGMIIVAAAAMLAAGSLSADEEYSDVLVSYQVKANGETSAVYGPGIPQPMADEKMVPVPEGLFQIPESMRDDLVKNGGEIVDYVIVYKVVEGVDIMHRARRRCHTHRNGDRHCPK